MSSPHIYPYEPLLSGNVFRYLILHPGVGDEALKCNLRTAEINDTRFEAISYAWGHAINFQPIECEAHVMMITLSLSTVLRRVRLPDKPLILWADGMCINQESLDEKGHQVALMGKIYRAAERVLIYVGSDDDDQGPALCSLLDEVDKMIQDTCEGIDMPWDSFPYPEEDDPILVDSRWDALYKLLSQGWFDRGWVVQEAASASYGQVIWGQSRFDWDKLMRVYVWLSTRASATYHSKPFSEVQINAHMDAYLEGHEDFGRAFFDEQSWGSPSLLRTLNCAKELDLSDHRDRIYAFMELPQNPKEHLKLKPDYHDSHLKTYRQFAIRYVQSTEDTELLDYVCHADDSLSQLPSWVPRWDITTWSLSQTSSPSSVSKSRTGSTGRPIVTDDDSLRVRSVIIDTVHYVSDLFDWDTTTPETFQKIWDSMNAYSGECPYTGPNGFKLRLDAFLDSLSAGTYHGEYSEWKQAQESFSLEAQLRHADKGEEQLSGDAVAGADEEVNVFYDLIRSRTHNRRFILTERGYMGLAPALVCKGDSCGIIFGCKKPGILRKAAEEQHYTFVGAASLVGRECSETAEGGVIFCNVLGEDDSKDWVEWDVEEQDIYLC